MLTELNILKILRYSIGCIWGMLCLRIPNVDYYTQYAIANFEFRQKKGDLRFSHASVYLCQRMYLRLAIGGKKEIYDFCTIV